MEHYTNPALIAIRNVENRIAKKARNLQPRLDQRFLNTNTTKERSEICKDEESDKGISLPSGNMSSPPVALVSIDFSQVWSGAILGRVKLLL